MNDRQREATVIDARRDAELAAIEAEAALERGDANGTKEHARAAMRAAWRAWLNAISDEDRGDAQLASEAAEDASEAALDADPTWDEQEEQYQAEADARLAELDAE